MRNLKRKLSVGEAIQYGASGIKKRLNAYNNCFPLQGKRILDVGCGRGAYLLELADNFDELYGIDIESDRLNEFLQIANDKHPNKKIRIEQMSADKMTFEDNFFDVITATEVIEHIHNLDSALYEICRVLKPKGLLYISCPNRYFPLETHYIRIFNKKVRGIYLPFLPYLPFLHTSLAEARNFTSKELKILMDKSGLNEIAVTYIMPPFDNWKFGNKYIKPMTEFLEKTFLEKIGMSIIAVYKKYV